MSKPNNQQLYNQVKKEIYAKYKVNSAYRSSALVKEYKARGGTYAGKNDKSTGLSRWHREKWVNQRGEPCSYKKKGDICRPSIKINKHTPTTLSELKKKEISKAMKMKKKTGRVTKFKKG